MRELAAALALLGAAASAQTPYMFRSHETATLESGPVSATFNTHFYGAEHSNAWCHAFLANEGPRPERVTLAYRSAAGRAGGGVERILDMGPGERRDVIVSVPPGVTEGRVIFITQGEDPASQGFYFSHASETQVLSVGSDQAFSSAVGYPPIDPEQTPQHEEPGMRVATLTADQLPVELSSYSGISTVFLGSVALEELLEPQRRALEAFAATGGRLALGRCGPATVAHLPLLTKLPEARPVAYGFGQVLGCQAGPAHLAEFVSQRNPPLVVPVASSEHTGIPRLLPEAAPPVGRFLSIVTLFALAVGPGSFWIVRRRGPALLLLTLPGTALFTCAVMIVSAFLGSGLRTQASTRSLALLDTPGGRAVTVGMGGFFSGRTPGDLLISNSSAWFLESASVSVRSGYILRSGFIPGRTYTEVGMAAVVPTRARLQLRDQGGALRIQNALGARVKSVYVRRGKQVWTASEIAEGGEERASPGKTPPPPDWPLPEPLRAGLFRGLEENEFLALAEGPGFLPLGDLAPDSRRSEVWIRGRVAP